jgi:glutathione S-transferase
MSSLVIHGFETSNNLKVRVSLGYKQIPYRFVSIEPGDREEVLRISGQALTPVMTHGDVVLFDSAAIMRYLDANFRDTPRLYGDGRETTWPIEDWERFARGEMGGPLMDVVKMHLAGGNDPVVVERAAAQFAELVQRLEDALDDRDWLVGDTMTAADIATACVIARVQRSGLFPLPESPRVSAWTDRVMAFDRGPDA